MKKMGDFSACHVIVFRGVLTIHLGAPKYLRTPVLGTSSSKLVLEKFTKGVVLFGWVWGWISDIPW